MDNNPTASAPPANESHIVTVESAAACMTFEALLGALKLDFWIPTFEEYGLAELDAFRGHEDGHARLSATLEDAGIDPSHIGFVLAALFQQQQDSLFELKTVTLNQDAVDQDRREHTARVEATRIKWLADKAAAEAAEALVESSDELECKRVQLLMTISITKATHKPPSRLLVVNVPFNGLCTRGEYVNKYHGDCILLERHSATLCSQCYVVCWCELAAAVGVGYLLRLWGSDAQLCSYWSLWTCRTRHSQCERNIRCRQLIASGC